MTLPGIEIWLTIRCAERRVRRSLLPQLARDAGCIGAAWESGGDDGDDEDGGDDVQGDDDPGNPPALTEEQRLLKEY